MAKVFQIDSRHEFVPECGSCFAELEEAIAHTTHDSRSNIKCPRTGLSTPYIGVTLAKVWLPGRSHSIDSKVIVCGKDYQQRSNRFVACFAANATDGDPVYVTSLDFYDWVIWHSNTPGILLLSGLAMLGIIGCLLRQKV